MSITHLIYDTGTIHIPLGPVPLQIGPTLDVRKYAKIRVVAHDPFLGPPAILHIHFHVREGNISIPLPSPADALVLAGGPLHNASKVIDVPGRELEMFIHDFPGGFAGKNLRLFIFGLEL
jgi:hypothetical protein